MNILMTPEQVLERFPSPERLSSGLVDNAKILLAQIKYLVPMLSLEVVEELCDDQYGDYVEEYLHAPLAMLVRYIAMEHALVDVGAMGVQQYSGDTLEVASIEMVSRQGATLRSNAMTLIKEAARALEAYPQLSELYQKNKVCGGVNIRAGFIF